MFYNNRITHRVITGYDRFTGSFTVELRDKDDLPTAPKKYFKTKEERDKFKKEIEQDFNLVEE